jgi:translation initiation factor IF-2
VQVTSGITVGELADALEVPGNEVVKRLFLLGTPLTLTQSMSDDLVELIAGDIGREVKIISPEEEMSFTFHDDEKDLKPRPPVVTVMGHVDHGKTSLLDAIRHSGVQQAEAGGITQAIGASVVWINGNQITFIDTPGHEAFTAMRARGAQVTDIIVLVVAADDGVMPQTIEAIDHAKAADVPIVVAINKIDKPGANPERVKTELAERGVIPEEWGGNNMFVEVSARQNLNIDELLETIILQAEVLELKANPDTTASGFVIEANLDKGRGPVATVIVQRGTLHVGDALVAGVCFGHVRALVDPKGNSVKEARPADPVEILGLSSVPSAGDEFAVFENESEARSLAAERELKQRLAAQEAPRHMNLDDLFARIEANKHAELNLIVKADTQGSIEALRGALEKMDQSEVRINVIRAAVGGVTETDVNFAAASDAIIIGFGVRPQAGVRQVAEREKVDIRLYRVIYQAIEDINAARVGLLAPEEVEVDTGSATVRETFKMPKVGVIAGCIVTEGEIANTDRVRIVRDGVIVHDGAIMSMRHYRDDVSSVRAGTECGIGIEDFQDIKEGDVIEGYRIEQVARKE